VAIEEDVWGSSNYSNKSSSDSESKSYFVMRLINFTRIVLYGIAVWVQLSLLIVCFMSGGYCDVFTVLVPLFLILLDMLVIRWSRNPFSQFLAAALVVSVLSIFVAGLTAFPVVIYPVLPTIDEYIMYILSLGVGLVSFIEMWILIYLTRPQEDKSEKIWDDSERTYDTQ